MITGVFAGFHSGAVARGFHSDAVADKEEEVFEGILEVICEIIDYLGVVLKLVRGGNEYYFLWNNQLFVDQAQQNLSAQTPADGGVAFSWLDVVQE